jgi:O-antigen/teichoic acid export membrane protein
VVWHTCAIGFLNHYNARLLPLGLAKTAVGTFVSKIAIFIFHLPIGILVARFLGPEGKGLLHLLSTSLMMCATFGSLGLGPASIYFIGKDPKRLPAVVGNLFAVIATVVIVTGFVGWGFLRYIRPDIYAQLPVWMWGITAFMLPLQLMRGLLMQVVSAILRIKEINLLEVAATATHLFLLILFVVVLEAGVGGAFLASAFSVGLAAIGFLILVIRHGGRPTKPDFPLLRASMSFGLKTYLGHIMRALNLRLDLYLVTTLAVNGIHAAGVYTTATGFAEFLLFIPTSIRLSLFPMVTASSSAAANRLTSASCRQAILLTSIGALGLGLLGPLIIRSLYGEAFRGAVIPMLILLPGVVMLSQANILYSDFNGRGKPGATTISASISLIITILLDLALIPQHEIIGAAIASTSAYTIEFLIAGIFFIHYSGTAWRDILVIRRSDLSYYRPITRGFRRAGLREG